MWVLRTPHSLALVGNTKQAENRLPARPVPTPRQCRAELHDMLIASLRGLGLCGVPGHRNARQPATSAL
jgi:hypothetical protein